MSSQLTPGDFAHFDFRIDTIDRKPPFLHVCDTCGSSTVIKEALSTFLCGCGATYRLNGRS
jgi:hypothetical protein